MPPAPDSIDSVIERVVAALADDDIAAARRLLVRARRGARDDQMRGTIAALDVACARMEAEDHEPWRGLLDDLRGESADDLARFVNAVGCALSEVGDQLGDDRFLELADDWFRAATTRVPDALTFANHGVVLYRMERPAEAAVSFQRALAIDGELHGVRVQMARCLMESKDLDSAAHEYRTYLAARPDDAHEWISLAIVECDAGRMDAAEQAYWRAAGLQPSNPSLHYNWLITALRVGDEDRAAYARRKLEEIAPGDWRTSLARAGFLERSGDLRAAFALVTDALLDATQGEQASDSESLPEHIASHAARLGKHPDVRAEARRLVDEMIGRRALPEAILDLDRQLDASEPAPVRDFAILLDALYTRGDPYGSLVNYRVFAADAQEARVLAADFERRCGASDTLIDELEEVAQPADPEHRGVWWRSEEAHYPAEEFKK